MAVRLAQMRRLPKPTGSIYRHCDPTKSHYFKLVMDAILGRQNAGGGIPRKDFPVATGLDQESEKVHTLRS